MNIFFWIIIGGLAGWIANNVMKGGSQGLLSNIIVGIVGAFVGGWLFNALNISPSGMIGSLITAVVGAIVLIYVLRLVRSRK